jgi:hypothetical protein
MKDHVVIPAAIIRIVSKKEFLVSSDARVIPKQGKLINYICDQELKVDSLYVAFTVKYNKEENVADLGFVTEICAPDEIQEVCRIPEDYILDECKFPTHVPPRYRKMRTDLEPISLNSKNASLRNSDSRESDPDLLLNSN